MSRKNLIALLATVAALIIVQSSCGLVTETLKTGGEKQLKPVAATAPPKSGIHVLIFALDGATPAKLMDAIHSDHAPFIAKLLGKDQGNGVFEHAYAAPHALSVLPSSTIADWAATFTGAAPAYDGVPGDEWFQRETMQFFAPVPVSVPQADDNGKVVTDNLIGKVLKTPTLFEKVHVRSNVSLLSVYRGATLYTIVSPRAFTDLIEHLIRGQLKGEDPEKSLSAAIDRESTQKLLDAIEEHGLPDLQVVYYPGIDIFTHAAPDRLEGQTRYLEHVTDGAVGRVLEAYSKAGVLDQTYVIFISDHAHIPTLDDEGHRLGTDDEHSPFEAVKKAGFRVRRASLVLSSGDEDYQAVLAYQGFMAYVYLADRSTCIQDDAKCNWKAPPRFREDVMPVLKSFYRSNTTGLPVPKLKGTLDLIFARPGVPAGENALPYMIFDGVRLVSIKEYLRKHPRPELANLEQRMNWLSAGPYGNRAGDILLLARACTNIPIEDRYFFAGMTHYTWHGSACEQDSHIPFILAKPNESGDRLRSIMADFGGAAPSQRELTPLVVSLFGAVPQETASKQKPPSAR